MLGDVHAVAGGGVHVAQPFVKVRALLAAGQGPLVLAGLGREGSACPDRHARYIADVLATADPERKIEAHLALGMVLTYDMTHGTTAACGAVAARRAAPAVPEGWDTC